MLLYYSNFVFMLKIVEYTLKTIFLSILLSACGGSEKIDHMHNQGKVIASINEKMSEQETCWNTGDLECFMQHYWHSDSLLFIGKSGLTYGWQPTLDNYISGDPDKYAMGKLTFTNEMRMQDGSKYKGYLKPIYVDDQDSVSSVFDDHPEKEKKQEMMRHGPGVQIWPNGSKYEGEW